MPVGKSTESAFVENPADGVTIVDKALICYRNTHYAGTAVRCGSSIETFGRDE
jgi:hypothetical protein